MVATEKAREGLRLLEQAVLEALAGREDGYYNSELARALDIESSHGGRHDKYLTYSVLGGLISKGLVTTEKRGSRIYYQAVK